MNLNLFHRLPIEIQSKIMFSGYLKNPLSLLIDDFIKEEEELKTKCFDIEKNTFIEKSFYNHLQDTGYFRIKLFSEEEVNELADLFYQLFILHDDDYI